MTERRHPDAKCEDCPLSTSTSKRRYVPSYGPATASVAFIGEAPGRNEARDGRPFTGVSGKLLATILRSHGHDIEDAFLTNACLCRPSGNATPSPAAIRACRPRLVKELQDRGVDTVITLGNSATEALAGRKTKITKERLGPPKQATLRGPEQDVTVRHIPTIHPAATLRNSSHYPDLVTDIGKLSMARTRDHEWVPPTVEVIEDPEEAFHWFNEQAEHPHREIYTFDIETGYEKDSEFVHPDRFLCAGISYQPNHAMVIAETALLDPKVSAALGRFLTNKRIVAHNEKFDLGVMHHLGIATVKAYGDTMLAHYCLDERRGTHGLKYLGRELFGCPDWEADIGAPKDRLQDADPEKLWYYNGIDAAVTFDLWTDFEADLKSHDGLWDLHNMLLEFSHALKFTELEGIGVDTSIIDQLTKEFGEELADIEKRLFELTEVPLNPRSPKQVMELLASLWGTKTSTTNEDWVTKRIEVLGKKKARRAKEEEAFLGMLLEHRKATKLYGTYVKGIDKRREGLRIHPSFLVHGTTTGRLACRNPNVQNVPRGSRIRRIYVPDPGNSFVQADYQTAELRVMAVLSGDRYLSGVFAEGRDLHSDVAARFWGQAFTKEQRVRAKAVVYGLNYGREAFSLAEEMGIPQAEAQSYINQFFELIPEVAEWRRETVQQVLSGKPLVSPFGRRHRVWLITNQNKQDVIKEGLAFLPQGTSSDITMHAFAELRRRGVRTRIPVHDSILAECPTDRVVETGRLIKEVMEWAAREYFSDKIPFPVDVEAGPNWGDLEELPLAKAL